MSSYAAGDYIITVSVLDKQSGEETFEETIINWRN
jgi:hypothetical protein